MKEAHGGARSKCLGMWSMVRWWALRSLRLAAVGRLIRKITYFGVGYLGNSIEIRVTINPRRTTTALFPPFTFVKLCRLQRLKSQAPTGGTAPRSTLAVGTWVCKSSVRYGMWRYGKEAPVEDSTNATFELQAKISSAH